MVVVVVVVDELVLFDELTLLLVDEALAVAPALPLPLTVALALAPPAVAPAVALEAWLAPKLDRSGTSEPEVTGATSLNLPHRSNTRLVCETGMNLLVLTGFPKNVN